MSKEKSKKTPKAKAKRPKAAKGKKASKGKRKPQKAAKPTKVVAPIEAEWEKYAATGGVQRSRKSAFYAGVEAGQRKAASAIRQLQRKLKAAAGGQPEAEEGATRTTPAEAEQVGAGT